MAIVTFDNLGLCNCGKLLDRQALASDGGVCPACCNQPNEECFGIKNGEKKRWLGPDGKWVQEQPKENFTIGGWKIGKDRDGRSSILPKL